MKKNIIKVWAAIGLALLFASCKKDGPIAYNSAAKAELSVEFDNIVGGADLQLNTATYTNAVGESFKVTKMKYYVSNFKLTKTDGTIYTVPQDSSYFLIEEGVDDEAILNVPEGEYTAISFVVGVDSLRNTMDISRRTGVLDPAGAAADMYWGWNSGYIFLKLEGTSPSVAAADHVFMYHSGGFGGYSTPTPNNLKTITLDLTARGTPKVKQNKTTNIHLMVDALKVLNGSTNMSFAAVAMIHSPLPGVPLANNYANMFRHDHTEN
ncbi:MbnP family protein [Ferruginibacter sp. HRS2-29]|uniref:MbnP family protein n=1 Tax=Ferruginibacter sp. HRS2-29 TaxID=2487334 RepID=UPI0020CBA302|nr:MbnP family protein [Ferruginibacter sp. HRS2-29]MCP9749978.1 hypothetical protein [Ferruginibacter sp. HRS2-29]